jgi:RNA 2',3'-cyclic 3'-phosphodiesterase
LIWSGECFWVYLWMIRLFIAMHIPFEIRDKIFSIVEEIEPDYRKYRWENIDKIHLTLKFIGNVDENITEQIKNKLSFIEKYNKFHFRISGFNFFFRNSKPQILWIGLGTSDPLKNLVKEIEDTLVPFSIPLEKRGFKAHLTLLRIKENPGAGFIDAFKKYEMPEIKFVSSEVMLMQSLLKPSGSEYKELKVYKLK